MKGGGRQILLGEDVRSGGPLGAVPGCPASAGVELLHQYYMLEASGIADDEGARELAGLTCQHWGKPGSSGSIRAQQRLVRLVLRFPAPHSGAAQLSAHGSPLVVVHHRPCTGEEELMRAVPHGIKFEGHRASIHENDMPMVRGIAGLLKAFPRLRPMGEAIEGRGVGRSGSPRRPPVFAPSRTNMLRLLLARCTACRPLAALLLPAEVHQAISVRPLSKLPSRHHSEV